MRTGVYQQDAKVLHELLYRLPGKYLSGLIYRRGCTLHAPRYKAEVFVLQLCRLLQRLALGDLHVI